MNKDESNQHYWFICHTEDLRKKVQCNVHFYLKQDSKLPFKLVPGLCCVVWTPAKTLDAKDNFLSVVVGADTSLKPHVTRISSSFQLVILQWLMWTVSGGPNRKRKRLFLFSSPLWQPKIRNGLKDGRPRKSAGVAQYHRGNWPPAHVRESWNMFMSCRSDRHELNTVSSKLL